MLQPELVREICHQMVRRSDVSITVKCRTGTVAHITYHTDANRYYLNLLAFTSLERGG